MTCLNKLTGEIVRQKADKAGVSMVRGGVKKQNPPQQLNAGMGLQILLFVPQIT